MKNVSINSFTRGNISPEKFFPIQFVVVGEVVTFVKRIETHNMSNITDKKGVNENHLARRIVRLIPSLSGLVNNLSQSSESILSSFIFSLISALVPFIGLPSENKFFRRSQEKKINPTIMNEIIENVHIIAVVGPCDSLFNLSTRSSTALSISASFAFEFFCFNSFTASSLNCL